jgi:hypothetical protein
MFERRDCSRDMISPSLARQRPRAVATKTISKRWRLNCADAIKAHSRKADNPARVNVSPPARHRSQPTFRLSQITSGPR